MLLRHIRYFLAVAEQRSFTRAADALHVSQPTLSQQVRQLEDTLGVQLFDRSGRTVQLTEFGEVYARHARAALHDVADLGSGSLRLAMMPTFAAYLSGSLIDAFHADHPNVALTIDAMPQERIEALLADDRLDAGFAFMPPRAPDIDALPLWDEPLALVTGRTHRLARRRRALTPAELGGEPLVLLSRAFATRERIDRYFIEHGAQPKIAIETNTISAVLALVRCGRLATVLPDAVARESADLCALEIDPPLPARTAALLTRKGAYRSVAARTFIARALAYRDPSGA
ncbi:MULTISPECIES: transcriptional regulator CynR [unclassified Burkholderia]|uniref:transcriptional regulator CynR n=1 Tax=unclassified Burkholderia TaxID=2613784 RepID=UPI001423B49B|nr:MULTISPECIES: transcriptional regulator CynR [unclassified Burkholderia]NIE58992.1 transcriptional regulator CynR [Burkholderia sp. Ap-955]NIF13403.1 transcriptional regulator CynR [Burkholderia sp. Ax-1735]NIG06438.1 transcriptional regulator CynR [Burkholderia sp. Tr-849]